MNLLNVILSVIITSIAVIFSISNLAKKEIEIKDIIKFLLCFIPIMIIICLYFNGVQKIVFIIIITSLILYSFVFDKNISKSIYYSLSYEILAFLVELLLSIIMTILNLDTNSYEQFEFAMLVLSVFNCLIVYIITKFKFIQKITLKFYNNISKNKSDWVYISIMMILMILLITFNRYNISRSISFYINVAMFIFTFISLLFVIYNKIKMDNIESKYSQMMDYVSKYEKIINEQGKKNHEYNNQLMVIKGYLKTPKKLEEYLNLVIEDHKCGQNYLIKQLSYFPDGGIKGLIYHKLSRMEEFNIKPYLYIDSNIKNIFEEKLDINTYKDITKLLGVFLDNAIEAAKDTNPKEIEFEIKKEEDCLIISISNTYDTENDISKVGKRGYSTKGAGHGFGLSIVKDISKNNKNIETFNDKVDNKFKQTIIIYYK